MNTFHFHPVISAFPGVGKSEAVKRVSNLVDLDLPGIPMPDYIEQIRQNLADGKQVLVPSWDTLRLAMREAGIVYSLVYPQRDLKADFMLRYIKRGSPDSFVKSLRERWDHFMDTCEQDPTEHHVVLRKSTEYLSDYLAE